MADDESLDHLARQFLNKEPELIRKTPSLFEELQNKNRYSDKKFWAEGGMKRIYQVYDHSTGRYMAMAEIKPDLGKEYIKAFLREARLTAALDHPNIVTIHEIGFHKNKRPFFTMDFYSNRTLKNLVDDQTTFNLMDRLDIFIKVCDAIAYAHAKGVLHLDIKSPNIHVGKYGEVWVSDWGLGKSLEEHDPNESSLMGLEDLEGLNHLWTNHQGIKGTPGNVAPEQIESYEYADKLSDVYALGCLLYELSTSQKPFQGDPKKILDQTLKGQWKEPKLVTSHNLPNSLNAVIVKAMALNPDERYQSVLDLKKDLDLFLHGYSTQAENASFMKQFGLFFWRYRLAGFVALFSMFLLLIMSYYFIQELSRNNRRIQKTAEFAFDQTQKIAKNMSQIGAEREAILKATENSTLAMINILLKHLNPNWEGGGLQFDSSQQSMHISSPNITKLYHPQAPFELCVLKDLNLKKLSLSNSGISDLNQLKGLKLELLDIKDSKIKNLKPLHLLKVSELVLHSQQFTTTQLKSLPEELKVTLN
jgi:serine/threonine-protein kinase